MSRAVARGSTEWPALLDEMHPLDPPLRLRARGVALEGDARCVAVVGTRRPSLAGLEMAARLSDSLARRGFVIVSGLALGIDAAAHRAALDAGGRTVAVLGCGVDVGYPRGNRDLFERIAGDGVLVSEYPDGTAPDRWRFPRRNRLIAGMCEGVIVVEGAIKSGALITARCALDANRAVFAVPGSPLNPRARGANELIRTSQAALVLEAQHVLEELAPDLVDGDELPPAPPVSPPSLDDFQRAVLLLFDGSPLSLEAILARSVQTPRGDGQTLDRGALNLALVALEMRGFLARRLGAFELTPAGAAAAEAVARNYVGASPKT